MPSFCLMMVNTSSTKAVSAVPAQLVWNIFDRTSFTRDTMALSSTTARPNWVERGMPSVGMGGADASLWGLPNGWDITRPSRVLHDKN